LKKGALMEDEAGRVEKEGLNLNLGIRKDLIREAEIQRERDWGKTSKQITGTINRRGRVGGGYAP